MEIAKKEKPDLILLDILLGEENGISFLKKQKEDKEISKIPVVAFSNYDNLQAKKEAQNFGVKEYLIKTNFTPKEFVEKIKSYFRNSGFLIQFFKKVKKRKNFYGKNHHFSN